MKHHRTVPCRCSLLLKLILSQVALLLLTSLLWSHGAQSEEAPNQAVQTEKPPEKPAAVSKRGINDGQGFGIAIENDSKNVGGPGSDQAYSNGVHFAYIYARDQVPRWAPKSMRESSLLKGDLTGSTANFGLSLNHQIFTPNNIHVIGLQQNDRPYAAWLNVAFSVLLKNRVRSQSLELSLGAIGPVANGETVQNSFHKWIEVTNAAGWGNQLQNEPTVQLSYQQRRNFLEFRNGKNTYFDVIPMFGGGFGNVFIGLHTGILARLGYNLPDDIGPSRPSGSDSETFVAPMTTDDSRSSYYLFAGLRGNAVARNIFLDGNSFQPSHHVTKYPFTFETEVGLSTQIRPFSVTWRFVVRSPDFEQNSGYNSFASLGLSVAID